MTLGLVAMILAQTATSLPDTSSESNAADLLVTASRTAPRTVEVDRIDRRATKPFWAQFDVSGDDRTTRVVLARGTSPVSLCEHLTQATDDGYAYTVAPLGGVRQTGAFSLATSDQTLVLTWHCDAEADTPEQLVARLAMLAQAAVAMGDRLTQRFSPG